MKSNNIDNSDLIHTQDLTSTSLITGNLIKSNVVRTPELSSEKYVSGFTGEGYKLGKDANGNFLLELDRLSVRKDFTVYELIVSQIRASNGSIWVSDAIKILDVSENNNTYVCTIDTDGGTIYVPFVNGDILRCQRFNGKNMKYYVAEVIATDYANGTFTTKIIEGVSTPSTRDEVVRMGNKTDLTRQGALYLTSSDNGSPYLDVIDGVNSASLTDKMKVRLGNLNGIVDADLGTLSGYGIYAQNGFFKGKFIVQNGSNVYNKNEANTVINTAKNDAITISNNNINNALTALNIGGRNLVLNSSFLLGTQPWGFDVNVEYTDNQGYLTVKLNGANYPNAGLYQFIKGIESHSDYFLSVEIQKITNSPSTIRIGLESVDFRTIELKNDLNWNKYTFVFNSGSFSDLQPLAIKPTSGNVAEFRLKNIYLTKGNKANDWTPAPEDFQVQIDATLNASKAYSDAQDELKKIEANAYADGKVTAEEQRAIQDATNKANAAKAYADAQDVLLKAQSDAYADGKVSAEEQARITQAQANLNAAKEYAAAQDNLSKIETKAYADGIVDAEEQRAIDDAKAKLAEAKQHAEQQASQAQANAITAAGQDATNKANQAKNDAIAASNQFAQNAINALNIGGRNYYSNKSTQISVYESIIEERHTGNAPNGFKLAGNQYGTINIRLEKVINSNGWWTVSGYVRGDQSVEGGFDIDICDGESKRFYFTSDNNWTYFEYSYYVNNYDNVYNFVDFGRLSWLYFYFKNIKVEKGNKATDWSPAPEDIDDAITVFKTETATKFQVLETQISSKVSQNDFNSLGQRVSSAESSIIQNANEISSKVSKTEFTELNNTVAGINGRVSNTESAITQQSNLIATKVTQTDVDVSIGQIRVGGRNLIKGTSNQLIKVDTSSWGITELGNILVNIGDEITVSVFVKDFSKPIMLELWGLDGNNNRLDTNARSTDVVNNILQATIRFNVVGVVRMLANLAFTSPQSSSETYTYSKVKFERGNKATDWTPAPEDIDDTINNLDSRIVTNTTAITQKADTIALNATRLDLINYTNNELQPVKDRISSAELKITPDAINQTVSGQIDNKISDVVVIKDTREFNNPPSWYYDNYPRRTVQEFKRVTVLGLPNVGEDYAKLTTNVPWLDFSGGNIIQEAVQLGRTYTRFGLTDSWTAWVEKETTTGAQDKANNAYNNAVGYTNSQITQTKDEINLSVTTKIDNVKLGGRNYYKKDTLLTPLAGAHTVVKTDTGFSVVGVGANNATLRISNVITENGYWTISFEHRINLGGYPISIDICDSDQVIFPAQTSTDWQKYVATVYVNNYSSQYNFIDINNLTGQEHYFRNVKIEKGNKPTDWTPAPEDVQNQIDSVANRVSSAELKITSDAINSTVKTQTESIVNTAVSKIEVGGRNLILGTSTVMDFSNPTTEYVLKTYSFNKPLENGQDYCISFKIKTFAGKTSRIWYRTNQDRIGSFEATINFNEENQNQVKTYVAFFKANNSDNNIVFYNYGYASTEAQRLGNSGIIYDLKIEKGNKATDWSPAPEDVNTRLIQAETSISQNANAISLKATQGDIDNSIKNINIGGRNYYSNNSTVLSVYESIIEERHTGNTPNGFKLAGNQYSTTNARLEKVIDSNGWWTVSGYVRGSQDMEGGFDIDICDGATKRFYFTSDNNWTYFEYSYYVNNYNNVYNFVDFGKLSWLYFYFKNIKVEKGNKATDWSPAPEDIDTRISQAELKITPEAIKSTVKGQTESIVDDAVKVAVPVTKIQISTIGLDVNKYYPVNIGLVVNKRYKITIDRPLSSDYGMPSYAQHYGGFSAHIEWYTNGAGWGAKFIDREIIASQQRFANGLVLGSIGQVTEVSEEIIYLRGGSLWDVIIEGRADGYADVKPNGFSWQVGGYSGNVPVLDSISEIKSTVNRLVEAETSITQTKDEILLRATKTEVTTQVNQAKSEAINTASSDATNKANSAQNNAVTTSKTYTDSQIVITNNAIALKAEKSVVDSINNRLSSAELKITPDAINQTVSGQIDGAINIVFQEVAEIKDTRNFNNPPSWYYENYPFRTVREFKNIGVVGLPDLGEYYAQVTTFVPWDHVSGGNIIQEAVQLGRTYTRFGLTDGWTAWIERESTNGAQNKANDAYNNAVTYANSQITQTKDAIQLSVDQKISNIQIGGRNLVINSKGERSVVNSSTNTNNENYLPFYYISVELDKETEYTFSCEMWMTSNVSSADMFYVNDYGEHRAESNIKFPLLAWYRHYFTFTTGTAPQTGFLRFDNNSSTDGQPATLKVRNVKLEKGNKATDWTPAPEDVQGQIDDVVTRVSTAESKITQTANSITQKVWKSDITETVNNLQVGGRNYYKKTTIVEPLVGSHSLLKTDTGFDITGVVSNDGKVRLENVITGNGYWTISFEHKFGFSAGYPLSIDFCDGQEMSFLQQQSDWQKWSFTYNVTNYSNDLYHFIDINGLTAQVHSFRNIKVEKGNKATDWSPAPEDVQGQINSVVNRVTNAEFKITDESIKAVVKEQTQNIVNDTVLANIWGNGKPLNPDPTFKEGFNGLKVYNNAGTGAVNWDRYTFNSFSEVFPTTSGYGLYFHQNGDRVTSPNWGGFYFETQTRAKAKFIVRMLLAFEEGRSIEFHSNAFGDNGTQRWLTPTTGRGINNFTEYISYVECGETGTFSSTNFFAFYGGNSVSVRIAFAGVYDITDAINNYTTKEEIASSFTMTPGGITLAGKTINMAGMVTFGSLDADAQSRVNNVQADHNNLVANLRSLAYQDVVELSKLGGTIIENGMIKTTLLDANYIKSNVVNASYINTLNIDASAIKSGTIDSSRIDANYIKSNIINSAYINTLELNASVIKSGTIDSARINVNDLFAQNITATGQITATDLTVTGNSKVAGFKISGDALVNTSGDASIEIGNDNDYVNMNASSSLLSIGTFNSNRTGINIQTYASGSVGLRIVNNLGGAGAIKSYGSHEFVTRDGETWNSPGVLAVWLIRTKIGLMSGWEINPLQNIYVSFANVSTNITTTITHNLGHTNYFPLLNGLGHTITNKTANSFQYNGGNAGSDNTIIIIGMNKVFQ